MNGTRCDEIDSAVSRRAPDKLIIPQCWAVNVKGNLWLFREAAPTLETNPEGGVFILTSSVAVRLLIEVPRQRMGLV